MKKSTGKRVVERYTAKVDAPPKEVFPLLCPVREYEWIEGWACEMVYSDTGAAENNCIFKTKFLRGVEATWVVSKFDEDNFVKEFVIFYPDMSVERIDVSLKENEDGSTTLQWTRTSTGLSQKGNQMLEHTTGETFQAIMAHLVESLNHYCRTGEKLAMSAGH